MTCPRAGRRTIGEQTFHGALRGSRNCYLAQQTNVSALEKSEPLSRVIYNLKLARVAHAQPRAARAGLRLPARAATAIATADLDRTLANGFDIANGGVGYYPIQRQKSLNRVGESSVYRTVCWIERWPSQSCRARVSWPAFASAYPQACRSMWQ
jgi:hypothetical protein